MLEVILSTLGIIGWLGIVLGIFVIVNTVCGTVTNVSNGESFSFKKMFKGTWQSWYILFKCSFCLSGYNDVTLYKRNDC